RRARLPVHGTLHPGGQHEEPEPFRLRIARRVRRVWRRAARDPARVVVPAVGLRDRQPRSLPGPRERARPDRARPRRAPRDRRRRPLPRLRVHVPLPQLVLEDRRDPMAPDQRHAHGEHRRAVGRIGGALCVRLRDRSRGPVLPEHRARVPRVSARRADLRRGGDGPPASRSCRALKRGFPGVVRSATASGMSEQQIGIVRELWRYPVKSMGGEPLERSTLGPLGIPGDRGWAVRDEAADEIRGAKKLPALLRCVARYRVEPTADHIPPADLVLPDGARTATDDPEVDQRLSALLGRRVTLHPRRPPEDRAHYRRGRPDHDDMETELRAIFGRLADEPLPDLSVLPPELFEYTSPLGTYFDVSPIHLLTTASLAVLGPSNPFDRRRFRPNVLVETDAGTQGLVEAGWSGRTIRVGRATLRGELPTMRCVMVTLPQPDLPKEPAVLRTIVRAA